MKAEPPFASLVSNFPNNKNFLLNYIERFKEEEAKLAEGLGLLTPPPQVQGSVCRHLFGGCFSDWFPSFSALMR